MTEPTLVQAPLILVVEDDFDVRDAVVDVLRESGYRVAEAVHGEHALSLLHSGLSPALILLDVMMPVMDGYGFRAAQQRVPEFAAIPVLVLSAARTVAKDIHTLGAAGYVPKPANLSDLLREVQRIIE